MSAPAPAPRLTSLDQFRGYTVAGMLLVNFLGGFAACPTILKHHHTFCSYADTIMPQFLFAVGFAFRLTLSRTIERQGAAAAYGRVVRRLLGLVLVALVIYVAPSVAKNWAELTALGPAMLLRPLKREWFQTLMHIAVTSLWILPVIRAGAGARILFACGSAALHVGLSAWFNFVWVNTDPNGIDGGPLGFLTWTIPAIVGTLACDAVRNATGERRWTRLVAPACGLMLLGWLLSCGTRCYDVPVERQAELRQVKLAESPVVPRSWPASGWLAEPPFTPPPDATQRKWNYWMMSQRGGTLSYLTFSAGFALLVCAGFVWACDGRGWRVGVLQTFGTNALAAYILHELVDRALTPFAPRDAPGWYVALACGVFFGINWLFLRALERNQIFLRV